MSCKLSFGVGNTSNTKSKISNLSTCRMVWTALFLALFFGCSADEQTTRWQTWQKMNSSEKKSAIPNPGVGNIYSLAFGGVEAPDKLLGQWLNQGYNVKLEDLKTMNIEKVSKGSSFFDCTGYSIDENLIAFLTSETQLEWLRLNRHVSAEDLEWISTLSSLKGLSMEGVDLTTADMSKLSELKQLQWLDLGYATFPDSGIQKIGTLPELKFLSLSGIQNLNGNIHQPGQFPNLVSFSANDSNFSDGDLAELVEVNPDLTYLHLPHCKLITEDAVNELVKLKQLRYLHLGKTTLESQLFEKEYGTVPELQVKLNRCSVNFGT